MGGQANSRLPTFSKSWSGFKLKKKVYFYTYYSFQKREREDKEKQVDMEREVPWLNKINEQALLMLENVPD